MLGVIGGKVPYMEWQKFWRHQKMMKSISFKKHLKFIPQRVRRGILYLNENYPGWVEQINLYDLDMSTWGRCLLGQILSAKERVDISTNFMEFRGFYLENDNEVTVDNTYIYYERLTEEWTIQINKLRAKCVPHTA